MQAQVNALWKKITGEFDLENEPDRLELLFQACETADQIAELDEATAEAPLTVNGSMGQPASPQADVRFGATSQGHPFDGMTVTAWVDSRRRSRSSGAQRVMPF
ncbi:hypothetical protein [Mycobacterium sp. 852002-51163_SCH5372311]|uniref:hypothetical protein n=1 Tax=Mycobacterium sp. 852002-51163_SCH5372311 TaxID=1834097 RepID=UPI0012E8CE41|nr:hypothetical protein [Mycobacterium sp. 852002-51163_SCH5372311]